MPCVVDKRKVIVMCCVGSRVGRGESLCTMWATKEWQSGCAVWAHVFERGELLCPGCVTEKKES